MIRVKTFYVYIFFLVSVSILFTSCFYNNEESATEEPDLVVATIAPPKESDDYTVLNETTSTVEYTYEVNPILLDDSFDVLLNRWIEILGEDDPRTSFSTNGNRIIYYSDYTAFLEEVMIEDGGGVISYTPKEYEYHITKSFFIDDMGFYMYEFETTDWAENAFRSDLNDVIRMGDAVTLINYASDGYFFVRYDELNYYQLEYYVDNSIIIYHFSLYNGTQEQLSTFLDVCSLTGLQPCEELVAEISHSN